MPFGYDDAIMATLVVADYIYHRWFQDSPPVAPPNKVVVPTAHPGDIVPLLWGRYRVNKPLVAWVGAPTSFLAEEHFFYNAPFYTQPLTGYLYQLDQFFNVAIGFDGGVHRLKSMWAGDVELGQNGDPTSPGLSVLVGDGTGGDPFPNAGAIYVSTSTKVVRDTSDAREITCGFVEFLNGAPDQTLVTPDRYAGAAMVAQGVDPDLIPGYRGYLSVFLFNRLPDGFGDAAPRSSWIFGSSSSLPAMSFEMASYAAPEKSFYNQIVDFFGQGTDANPIDVIYDVLTGLFGKLQIDPARIDAASFAAAARICYADGIGFSMCYEQGTTAAQIIGDVLRQIDGVIYENPYDGKIYIKLIRADYDPDLLRELRPDLGCSKIQQFAAGGWTGLTNKVTVAFVDRSLGYVTNTAPGMGDANAARLQDTEVSEQLVSFPACCTMAMAKKLASRETSALCRPIAKFTAVCDQRYRNVNPGDVLAVTWPKLGLSRAFFRVAGSDRTKQSSDGSVTLQLIQEFFQVYRGTVDPYGPLPPLGHSFL